MSKLRNMSWDICHIRNLYENSLALYDGDLCIQYFCTHKRQANKATSLLSISHYFFESSAISARSAFASLLKESHNALKYCFADMPGST